MVLTTEVWQLGTLDDKCKTLLLPIQIEIASCCKLVFRGVMNILIGNSTMIQNSFHSCLPFPKCFVQMIIFCNINTCQTPFKLNFKNPTNTLASSITYWVAFHMACPKHDLTNGDGKSRKKIKTTFVNALVKVLR